MSSSLDRTERNKIRRIVRAWKKGKIPSPEALHERIVQDLPNLWHRQSDLVKAELDRAFSRGRKGIPLKKIALGLMAVVVVLSLAVGVAFVASDYRMGSLEERLEALQEEVHLLEAVVTAQLVAVHPSPTVEESLAPSIPPHTPTSEPSPTPSSTTTPTHPPTLAPGPTLVVAGTVKGFEGIGLEGVSLTLLSSVSRETEDWRHEERVRLGGDGVFRLTATLEETPLYYRVEVKPPSGTYVEQISPPANWQVITDTLSGFPFGLESGEDIRKADIRDVTVILAAVPPFESESFEGTYAENYYRRTAPIMDERTLDISDTVPATVQVWGEWSGDEWRLACYRTDIGRGCFWSGFIQARDTYVVALPDEQESLHLPHLYLPEGTIDINRPPGGWAYETVDGVMVLASQADEAIQPLPLEWRVDAIQGWFRLEAWVPGGSEETTYQVFVLDGDEEKPLRPLAGIQKIEGLTAEEMGRFQDIGTYHLAQEGTVLVRLPHPGREGMKAGFVRLLKVLLTSPSADFTETPPLPSEIPTLMPTAMPTLPVEAPTSTVVSPPTSTPTHRSDIEVPRNLELFRGESVIFPAEVPVNEKIRFEFELMNNSTGPKNFEDVVVALYSDGEQIASPSANGPRFLEPGQTVSYFATYVFREARMYEAEISWKEEDKEWTPVSVIGLAERITVTVQ